MAFARLPSWCNRSMKSKVQHCKQQQSCMKKMSIQSEDTIASQTLLFQTFLRTKNTLKVMKHKHNSNWFYKLSFPNGLQTIVVLISCIAWVFVYDSCISGG